MNVENHCDTRQLSNIQLIAVSLYYIFNDLIHECVLLLLKIHKTHRSVRIAMSQRVSDPRGVQEIARSSAN